MAEETKIKDVALVEESPLEEEPPFHLQKYPDGTGLLFIAKGMSVFCYKILLELKFLIDYRGHTKNITALAFDVGTQYLFTAGEDKTIRVWNVKTGLEVCEKYDEEKDDVSKPLGDIQELRFHPGRQILYARSDNRVRAFQVCPNSDMGQGWTSAWYDTELGQVY
jgi:WD40 repeat protein